MDRIPLLYIAGSGHSGSTLLTMILSNHPLIAGAGELCHYKPTTYTKYTKRQLCACSKNIFDCDFWREVKVSLARYIENDGRKLEEHKLNILPYFINIRTLLKYRDLYFPDLNKEEADIFVKDNAFLAKSILEVSGKKILLDSSKIIPRLSYLYDSGLFDIKIIHLVRDGRAFISSSRVRDGVQNYKASIFWALKNYRALRFIKKKVEPKQFLKVRYEDLAVNPQIEVERICKFIGVSFSEIMLNFRTTTLHIIGGNPHMKNNKDNKVIKLDDK